MRQTVPGGSQIGNDKVLETMNGAPQGAVVIVVAKAQPSASGAPHPPQM